MRNHNELLKLAIPCFIFVTSTALAGPPLASNAAMGSANTSTKLSWFIPDGLRGDPDVFKIFQWAKEGKLPNIQRMMEMGSYGYSIPVFPSHTPTNFAALLTGTYPKTNGVADGPMRIEGKTLQKPAVAGFSSAARTVPAIWSEFAKDKRVVLLSLPGSTPPELKHNAVTIRGRWGGWGADFHSVIFEKRSIQQRKKLARNSRLFFQGMELTQYIAPEPSVTCSYVAHYGSGQCLQMSLYGSRLFAKLIPDKNGDGQTYSLVLVSRDGKITDGTLRKGEWSKWLPVRVNWNGRTVNTNVRFHLISLGPGDFFRIRVLVDSLNASIVEPPSVAADLESDVGPMVDFVDNFPPQLVYYQEDKETFIQESKMSFAWHLASIDAIYRRYSPDIFIHDIYSPNQMLTSKWWMGYVDPDSARYRDVSEAERASLWSEVLDMYKAIDAIVGKTLDNADKDTLVVLSSDHGVVPLDQSVRLNNLFAKKGWIIYSMDPHTGEQVINWEKSKVVFLKMSNIYVNPDGLGPTWSRGYGEVYEHLRSEVIEALTKLRDKNNVAPLIAAVRWEDAGHQLNLPSNRIGDIVVANRAGYGWSEDITGDLQVFATPLETGYKQAILADNVKGLWTPFIIVGRGIKKNFGISQPIKNVDQAPTILRALGMPIPNHVDGALVSEIFE